MVKTTFDIIRKVNEKKVLIAGIFAGDGSIPGCGREFLNSYYTIITQNIKGLPKPGRPLQYLSIKLISTSPLSAFRSPAGICQWFSPRFPPEVSSCCLDWR